MCSWELEIDVQRVWMARGAGHRPGCRPFLRTEPVRWAVMSFCRNKGLGFVKWRQLASTTATVHSGDDYGVSSMVTTRSGSIESGEEEGFGYMNWK